MIATSPDIAVALADHPRPAVDVAGGRVDRIDTLVSDAPEGQLAVFRGLGIEVVAA